jgi:hypothetical protein
MHVSSQTVAFRRDLHIRGLRSTIRVTDQKVNSWSIPEVSLNQLNFFRALHSTPLKRIRPRIQVLLRQRPKKRKTKYKWYNSPSSNSLGYFFRICSSSSQVASRSVWLVHRSLTYFIVLHLMTCSNDSKIRTRRHSRVKSYCTVIDSKSLAVARVHERSSQWLFSRSLPTQRRDTTPTMQCFIWCHLDTSMVAVVISKLSQS